MPNPQQPEVTRAQKRAGTDLDAIPEDNRPGHHPEHDQDKPTRRPPVPTAARKAGRGDAGKDNGRSKGDGRSKGNGRSKDTAGDDASGPGRLPPGQARHFSFAFEPAQLLAGLPFGITPLTTGVMVDEERLHIRYGPWSLTTPLDNVAGTTETGPYQLLKIAGPAHLSLADRGVAFCTRRTDGLCISFHEPVRAIAPVGPLLHPAATVTVSDRDGLRRLLDAR